VAWLLQNGSKPTERNRTGACMRVRVCEVCVCVCVCVRVCVCMCVCV
jgi:hypothetical protein